MGTEILAELHIPIMQRSPAQPKTLAIMCAYLVQKWIYPTVLQKFT
jgi:hypothetical protein